MSLRFKILEGFVVLMAVIICMVAIWVHEREWIIKN